MWSILFWCSLIALLVSGLVNFFLLRRTKIMKAELLETIENFLKTENAYMSLCIADDMIVFGPPGTPEPATEAKHNVIPFTRRSRFAVMQSLQSLGKQPCGKKSREISRGKVIFLSSRRPPDPEGAA